MADDSGTPSPDGDGDQGGKTADPPAKTPDGDGAKKLEDASTEELIGMVKELRTEAKENRTKASTAEEKVTELTEARTDLDKKIKELEDAGKTADEKEKERLEALETKASRADALDPYHGYVKAEVEKSLKRIDGMDDAEKQQYTDLLDTFGEDDYLLKHRAIAAIDAARGVAAAKKEAVESGDEGNPAEPGGGKQGQTPEALLGWSQSGMEEARMVGLVPTKSE